METGSRRDKSSTYTQKCAKENLFLSGDAAVAVLREANGSLRRLTLEFIKCKMSKVKDLAVGAATVPYSKKLNILTEYLISYQRQ